MEGFLDEGFIRKHAAQIHHRNVEEGIPVAEIAQVDEIFLVASENGVPVLQVTVDSCIGIGYVCDKAGQVLLFRRGEEGTLLQETEVAVLDIFKLGGVHMDLVQIPAHLGKFFGIFLHLLRIV